MGPKNLTKDQWSEMIREMLREFAKSATLERGDIDRAAEATQLSRPSIEKMKSSGTGSVESWIKLLAFKAELTPDQITDFFENAPSIIDSICPADELDDLFVELRSHYQKQELAAWMKLLISKRSIEEELGISLTAKIKRSPAKITRVAQPKPRRRS